MSRSDMLQAQRQQLEASACSELSDASSYLFFDDAGNVLAASFQVDTAELGPLSQTLGNRSEAIRSGMIIGGRRYEVHRHHPPLVYGRTMGGGDPDDSVGAALCLVQNGTITGGPCYGAITYRMPNLSARMVPMLEAFCDRHLRAHSNG